MLFVASSRSHGVSVFSTYRISPPASDVHAGFPWVTTSSVGLSAVTISGGVSGCGSSLSAGFSIDTRSPGGDDVGVHGPIGCDAWYQNLPLDRKWSLPRLRLTTANGVLMMRS